MFLSNSAHLISSQHVAPKEKSLSSKSFFFSMIISVGYIDAPVGGETWSF